MDIYFKNIIVVMIYHNMLSFPKWPTQKFSKNDWHLLVGVQNWFFVVIIY